jgi:hypothetical protein
MMNNRFTASFILLALLLLLAACGPTATVNQVAPQATITIPPAFQAQTSPLPTTPPYRCGAWASDNAPSTHSTITIYAKLTQDMKGVIGASAQAVVHFREGDSLLDQQPTSDDGGYVSFPLSLDDRQPPGVPATVDVTFTISGGTRVQCSPAFFTPR